MGEQIPEEIIVAARKAAGKIALEYTSDEGGPDVVCLIAGYHDDSAVVRDLAETIHDAILATREECAKVAEEHIAHTRRGWDRAKLRNDEAEMSCWSWSGMTAREIAAAIRALGSEKVEGGQVRKTDEQLLSELRAVEKKAPLFSEWRHVKSGKRYFVADHSFLETNARPAVVYTSDKESAEFWDDVRNAIFWTRDAAEFLDGRFERVEDPS